MMNFGGSGGSQDLYNKMLERLATELNPQESIASQLALVDWKPQDGPQSMAYHSPADEIFYGGAAGGGKMLDENALIATPDGWKTHKDIEVGDIVCNPDGTTSHVTHVFHKGIRKVYRVVFSDQSSVIAGDEHLWTINSYLDYKGATPQFYTTDHLGQQAIKRHPAATTIGNRVLTTTRLAQMITVNNHPNLKPEYKERVLVPFAEPVFHNGHWPEEDMPPAYVMGVALGLMQEPSVHAISTINQRRVEGYLDPNNIAIIPDAFKDIMQHFGFFQEGEACLPSWCLYVSAMTRMDLAKGIVDAMGMPIE